MKIEFNLLLSIIRWQDVKPTIPIIQVSFSLAEVGAGDGVPGADPGCWGKPMFPQLSPGYPALVLLICIAQLPKFKKNIYWFQTKLIEMNIFWIMLIMQTEYIFPIVCTFMIIGENITINI